MKALVGAFNQIVQPDFNRDCTTSPINRFAALLGTAPVGTVVAVISSETIYRFLPPVAAKPWSGVKDVRKVANSCVQIKGTAFGNFSGEQVSTLSTLSTLKLCHNKVNKLVSSNILCNGRDQMYYIYLDTS